jgi:hypothetical protein
MEREQFRDQLRGMRIAAMPSMSTVLALTRAVIGLRLPAPSVVTSGAFMIKKLAGTFMAVGALLAFTAPAAHAAPPEPFTINEDLDFVNGVFTFTTPSDGPLCPSGTFTDEVTVIGGLNNPALPKVNLLIKTVYTCGDGSGTFFAQKHVFLTFNEDGSDTNTGPITLKGGTGDYTGLSGHGVNNGTVTPEDIGVATISGSLKLR